MSHQGLLVVISGFSGAGKGTLIKELMKRYDQYALSVSATTRQPRPGEMDGREYFFVSPDYFQSMIENDALIEYAQYVENFYGTPKDYVERQRAAGKDVILEIEIQGALKIKKKFPETLLLFVMPPSAEELKRRLVNRGTESPELIQARLEAVGIEAYDYIILNDQLEVCVEELHQLIQAQHNRTSNRLEFLNEIRKGLEIL